MRDCLKTIQKIKGNVSCLFRLWEIQKGAYPNTIELLTYIKNANQQE